MIELWPLSLTNSFCNHPRYNCSIAGIILVVVLFFLCLPLRIWGNVKPLYKGHFEVYGQRILLLWKQIVITFFKIWQQHHNDYMVTISESTVEQLVILEDIVTTAEIERTIMENMDK